MGRRHVGTIIGLVLLNLLLAWKSSNGQIAFVALRDGQWRACVQTSLYGSPRDLQVAELGDASAPAISRDGRRLAYEIQGRGIRVIDFGSVGEPLVLRESSSDLLRPSWYPDQTTTLTARDAVQRVLPSLLYVQYAVTATGEDSELVGCDHQLRAAKPLVRQTGIQDYPDFSHNGRYLAYTSAQTVALHRGAVQVVQQLWIMDLNSGTARQLLLTDAQDTQPDWAPGGYKLAFASNRSGQFEIWVVNADGSGVKQLTSGPGTKTWPAWSPDGESVLFTMVKDGKYQLWLMDADGGNLRRFQPSGPGSEIEVRDADWR